MCGNDGSGQLRGGSALLDGGTSTLQVVEQPCKALHDIAQAKVSNSAGAFD